MAEISDATLSGALASRLRELRVFSLYARALGPRDLVLIVALAFDRAGQIVRVTHRAPSLEHGLVAVMAELEIATANETVWAKPIAIERPRESTRIDDAPALTDDDRRAHRRQVALSLARSRGAVTLSVLSDAMAGLVDLDSLAAVLAELVREGALVFGVPRRGLVLPEPTTNESEAHDGG